MLVHLAVMLSTANSWVLPSDDKGHDSPHASVILGEVDGGPHDSVILGEVDGGPARRQLASGCSGSWFVCRPRESPILPISCLYSRVTRVALAWPSCSQRFKHVYEQ